MYCKGDLSYEKQYNLLSVFFSSIYKIYPREHFIFPWYIVQLTICRLNAYGYYYILKHLFCSIVLKYSLWTIF